MANYALKALEAESITIFREIAALAKNPVLLYSIGKDSSVLLHLAKKAFYPSPIPFPVMHIDTTWKFKEMIAFRDKIAKTMNLNLIVYTNKEGIKNNINPITHGSVIHTNIMKTKALKDALNHYQFDMAIGGARRDEEISRAKERIYSFRNEHHHWQAKGQRPEVWNLFNHHKKKGESFRVFPLSNWTELDIWQYIDKEKIPIVPLYLAKIRPVIKRENTLIVQDDERLTLNQDEQISQRLVRFRTLGCYPLTGAIESNATSVSAIIKEIKSSRFSERQGRLIDNDNQSSMEKKKAEGYF